MVMNIESFKTLSVMLTILFVVGCNDAPTESTPVATSAPEAGSGVGGGAPMAAPEPEIIEETPVR